MTKMFTFIPKVCCETKNGTISNAEVGGRLKERVERERGRVLLLQPSKAMQSE